MPALKYKIIPYSDNGETELWLWTKCPASVADRFVVEENGVYADDYATEAEAKATVAWLKKEDKARRT